MPVSPLLRVSGSRSGPTSSASMWVKIGIKKDGRITGADALFKYQGGAFPGSPVELGAMSAFACNDLQHVRCVGYDVVVNRTKQAAYRAPGAPMAAFAVETVNDELAKKIGMDPIDLRLKNAAKEGVEVLLRVDLRAHRPTETLQAAKDHANYKAPLGKNQGRGIATGLRRPNAVGFNDITEGSRTTFSDMATIQAARAAVTRLCSRAAKMWGIPEDAVVWETATPSRPAPMPATSRR